MFTGSNQSAVDKWGFLKNNPAVASGPLLYSIILSIVIGKATFIQLFHVSIQLLCRSRLSVLSPFSDVQPP